MVSWLGSAVFIGRTGADRVDDRLTVLLARCAGLRVAEVVCGTVARLGTSSGLLLLLKDDHFDAIACSCFRVDFDFASLGAAIVGLARDDMVAGETAGEGTDCPSTIMKHCAIFRISIAAA